MSVFGFFGLLLLAALVAFIAAIVKRVVRETGEEYDQSFDVYYDAAQKMLGPQLVQEFEAAEQEIALLDKRLDGYTFWENMRRAQDPVLKAQNNRARVLDAKHDALLDVMEERLAGALSLSPEQLEQLTELQRDELVRKTLEKNERSN